MIMGGLMDKTITVPWAADPRLLIKTDPTITPFSPAIGEEEAGGQSLCRSVVCSWSQLNAKANGSSSPPSVVRVDFQLDLIGPNNFQSKPAFSSASLDLCTGSPRPN